MGFLQADAERKWSTVSASCHFVAYQPEKPPLSTKEIGFL